MLDQGAPAGPQHFTCKFSREVALVKCPSAFRLRRLARSVVPGLDLCGCARCSVPCFLRLVLSCLVLSSTSLLLHQTLLPNTLVTTLFGSSKAPSKVASDMFRGALCETSPSSRPLTVSFRIWPLLTKVRTSLQRVQ